MDCRASASLRDRFSPPQKGLEGQPPAQNRGCQYGVGRALSLTAWTCGKVGCRPWEAQGAPALRPGKTAPSSERLGFSPYVWPSASLHPFTSLAAMCQGQWPLASWPTPWGQDRERQRVNGLQRGRRRGCCEGPDSRELRSLGGPERKCPATSMTVQA